MAQAKKGDNVKVHYSGSLDDGSIFDSSRGKDPLAFTLGEKQVIEGFEEAVEGMNPGESKTVKIPCDQAYGAHREDLAVKIDRSQLPPSIDPVFGQQLSIPQEKGGALVVTVTEITDASITLDANHPLASEDLTFEIELVEIA